MLFAPEFCQRTARKGPPIKEGGGAPRGASIQWPHHTSGRYRPNVRGVRQRASQTSLRRLRNLSASAPARLPALHRGTRRTGRIQYRLSSRPALPETRPYRALPGLACHSLPSTSGTGHSAGRSGTQSRPGAVCETARGHRARSALQIASGKRPSDERAAPASTRRAEVVKRCRRGSDYGLILRGFCVPSALGQRNAGQRF